MYSVYSRFNPPPVVTVSNNQLCLVDTTNYMPAEYQLARFMQSGVNLMEFKRNLMVRLQNDIESRLSEDSEPEPYDFNQMDRLDIEQAKIDTQDKIDEINKAVAIANKNKESEDLNDSSTSQSDVESSTSENLAP